MGRKMKRVFGILVSAAVMLSSLGVQPASSFGLGGSTRTATTNTGILFIKARKRTIEPFAHVLFCTKRPSECRSAGGEDQVVLTQSASRELARVNAKINRQIRPKSDAGSLGGDEWSLMPNAGDCEDYAISKRHELIRKGWPARALRLAIAHTSWGEGHMVLIVRTNQGDLVLDSLNGRIRNWRDTGFKWEMIQAAGNPRIWHRI